MYTGYFKGSIRFRVSRFRVPSLLKQGAFDNEKWCYRGYFKGSAGSLGAVHHGLGPNINPPK